MLSHARLALGAVALPSTGELLSGGGDERIALDPATGLNRYLCPSRPDPDVLAYGSATAQAISPEAFAAAEALRRHIEAQLSSHSAEAVYADELQRIRNALFDYLGVHGMAEALFAASGTDLHRIAAGLAAGGRPCRVIAVASDETGSGVSRALWSGLSAWGGDDGELCSLAIRRPDGGARPLSEIDAEVESLAAGAIAAGQRVLLVVADMSKSGLIAPSIDLAESLATRFAGELDLLIDACQFRLKPVRVRDYLQRGCMVALTGSKFMGGPSFSGLLLLPCAMHGRSLPERDGDVAAEVNFGLLLRWRAALSEIERFAAVPTGDVGTFVAGFATAVGERFGRDDRLKLLDMPPLKRTGGDGSPWDVMPTVFPFLLRDGRGGLLDRDRSIELYCALQQPGVAPRCQLGQPVLCGEREGVAIAAPRLCLGARTIAQGDMGRAIEEAMVVLDRAVQLAARIGGA